MQAAFQARINSLIIPNAYRQPLNLSCPASNTDTIKLSIFGSAPFSLSARIFAFDDSSSMIAAAIVLTFKTQIFSHHTFAFVDSFQGLLTFIFRSESLHK